MIVFNKFSIKEIEVDLKCYSGKQIYLYARRRFKHSLDKINAMKKELWTVFSSKTEGSRFKGILRADVSPRYYRNRANLI
jgi:hypothetical protein